MPSPRRSLYSSDLPSRFSPLRLPSISSSPNSSVESLPPSSSPTASNYFGENVFDSPHSDISRFLDDIDDNSDAASDSTCEDEGQFGAPLERMPRVRSADHNISLSIEQQVSTLLRITKQSSSINYQSRSPSLMSVTSTQTLPVGYDSLNYEEIVDYMLQEKPDPFLTSSDPRHLVLFNPDPSLSPNHGLPPLMVKKLPRDSLELLLLLELNHPDYREDPWNSAPQIMCGVERDNSVYLCIRGLSEYNYPPLLTVAHYVDFFRQVLEGLTFLHEQQVAGLRCFEPSSFMVDLGSAPQLSSTNDNLPVSDSFDRSLYPVRYYFVNFSSASKVSRRPASHSSSPVTPSGETRARAADPFKRDVQDCGAMFDALLSEVPQITQKFRSLIKGMTLGGFTADDSRRLFEALCRSLDASVFDSKAEPSRSAPPVRSRTLAHHRGPSSLANGASAFPILEKVVSH